MSPINDRIDAILKDVLDETIEDFNKGNKPCAVVVDCPYAEYIEFGSDPAKNATSKVYDAICGDWVTETRLRIRDWAQDKWHLDDKARKRAGDKIYHNIIKNGIPPQPFVRPALYGFEIVFRNDPDYFLNQDNPSRAICSYLRDEMIKILETHGTYSSKRELIQSIIVVEGDEAMLYDDPFNINTKIQEEIWNDLEMDRHGVIRPNHYNK